MKGDSQDTLIKEELIACFPEWTEMIPKIYPQNKNFREVVEDYFFCKNKISRLSKGSGENTALLVQDEATMKELEEEMLEYLSTLST